MAYNQSVFPQGGFDEFDKVYDLPPSLAGKAEEYKILKVKQNKTQAEIDKLNTLTIELKDFIINPSLFNHMTDAITGIQKHYVEETSDYVNSLQVETKNYVDTKKIEIDTARDQAVNTIQTTKDSALVSIEQKKNNVIEYMDGTTAGQIRNDLGVMGELTTTNKNSLVEAINEVNAKEVDLTPIENDIGDLSLLETVDKSNLVNAVNEVNNNSTENANQIGNLNNLNTIEKSNLVGSVNEINTKVTDVNDELNRLRKINANQDKELAYMKLKQEATDRIEGGNLFANDMNGNSFGMTFKNVRTKSTEPLNIGETLLSQGATSKIGTIENGQFIVGDEVFVLDDVNSETVNITRSEVVQEVSTNTVTDATVVNSAYTTSASARPVILDNGWIVSSAYDSTNSQIKFFVSKDNLATTPTQLCYMSQASTPYWSVVNKGNIIYIITASSGGTVVNYFKIDATTQTNIAITPTSGIDSSQTAFNGVSLSISPDKTTLWAAWSSVNTTYSSVYNIRCAKGTINADGSVTWGAVGQVTTSNTSTADYRKPSITILNNNNPQIVVEGSSSAVRGYHIASFGYNGTAWATSYPYDNGGSYIQSNPQVVSDKNGVLMCVWHGLDSEISTRDNLRFSYSNDGGITWSAMQRLTSDTQANNLQHTITVNKANELIVLYMEQLANGTTSSVKSIKRVNSSWSSISNILSINANISLKPSSLYDNTFATEFSEPLFIYQNQTLPKVGFYGTWNAIKEQFYLECSPLVKSYKKGAWIAQSTMNSDGTFGKWDGNFIEKNVVDATVINQAFDTSGNGGRKLIRLKNGVQLAVVKNSTSWFLYKSTNNWATNGQLLETITLTSVQDICLETDGVNVFVLLARNNTTVDFMVYNGNLVNILASSIDTNQTALGNISLAINPQGTELHATWASTNATYPNSFNIRYAKGTINGDGSVTWGSAEQVTTVGTNAGINRPSIIVLNDKPFIFWSDNIGNMLCSTTSFTTRDIYTNAHGVNWGCKRVYYSGSSSYLQSSPSAIFVPKEINGLLNGRIWVAWHGKDSIDTSVDNIRVSYSDDGGVTWSAMQKLTSGNLQSNRFASLTANKQGNIFILFAKDSSAIQKISYNGVWSSITAYTTSTSSTYPSTIMDLTIDYSEPIFIYKDNTKVGFYGKWIVGSPTPLVSATAQYELPSTDYVGAFIQKQGNIIDVKAYINNELMDSELENNEYMFTKQLTTAPPITLRIEAERENTANSGDRISRVLGGFN